MGILMKHNSDKPAEMEGFPMKSWSIEIFVLDEAGNEKPANCFTKAVYNLHPTFPNPVQSTSLAFVFHVHSKKKSHG